MVHAYSQGQGERDCPPIEARAELSGIGGYLRKLANVA
jgi:hypothetical protein